MSCSTMMSLTLPVHETGYKTLIRFLYFRFVFVFFYFFCHTLNPSPSAGRVRGLKGSTHLSPVHALHFDLADWVSTSAPRQLTTNKLS